MGLRSDTEVNLWFYTHTKITAQWKNRFSAMHGGGQSFACLFLNLNVLLRSFLYFIITAEIRITYKDRCRHCTPLSVL